MKCTSIFFMLCLLSFPLKAQHKPLYEQAEACSLEVRYHAIPDSSSVVSNYFLGEIARSIPWDVSALRYRCDFRLLRRVVGNGPYQYIATIDLNNAVCSGDVLYRGFDMTDVIFPNLMDIQSTLLCKHRLFYFNLEYDSLPVRAGYNKIVSFDFRDSADLPEFRLTVDAYRLYYSREAISAFREKTELVAAYYATDSVIAAGMKHLEKYDFSNIEKIIVYDIMLKDAEKLVDELYAYNFPGRLNLAKNDPANFVDRFTLLSEETRSIRNRVDENLGKMDQLFYDMGQKQLAAGDEQKALYYFNRSVVFNRNFIPSCLAHARILMRRDSIGKAAGIMSGVLGNMSMDDPMKDTVLATGLEIQSDLIARGNELLQLHKYNEALEVFEKAREFCTTSGKIICTGRETQGIAASRYGILNSFVTVSRKAVESRRYRLAEDYLGEGKKYAESHKDEITDLSALDTVIAMLAHVYIIKGDSLASTGSYGAALPYFEKARDLCGHIRLMFCGYDLESSFTKLHNAIYREKLMLAHDAIRTGRGELAEELLSGADAYQRENSRYIEKSTDSDSLYGRIQSVKYYQYITDGSTMMEKFRYGNALALFKKAEQLSGKFLFRREARLDSLLKAAARHVIYEALFTATDFFKVQQNDSAEKYCNYASRLLEEHGLQNDVALAPQIADLDEKLFRLKCSRAKDEFEKIMEKAASQADSGDFAACIVSYGEAVDFARGNPGCKMDTASALRKTEKYANAGNYQLMMSDAARRLLAGDTLIFFAEYAKAEQFFKSRNLSREGLRHVFMADSVKRSKSPALIIAAIKYYRTQERNADCLDLMFHLKATGISIEKVTSLQSELAVALAGRDYNLMPPIDPKLNVEDYTRGDPWMNEFRNVYLRTFRNLDRK